MPKVNCIVVTPEKTALEQPCDFLALPLFDGEIGIAGDHSPMIGRLGYGEMRIKENGEQLRFYVDGGFVQVADNVVAVITNRAIPAAELDTNTIESQLAEARSQPSNSPELMESRDRSIAQARAQLRVAGRQ
ncbi:MAG: ATP synthase F1 subunit epsilon [Pirellulaceae bacterium]|nr:ATP synthase F1 subunit epsilon [Pirellulaceae bacterium]